MVRVASVWDLSSAQTHEKSFLILFCLVWRTSDRARQLFGCLSPCFPTPLLGVFRKHRSSTTTTTTMATDEAVVMVLSRWLQTVFQSFYLLISSGQSRWQFRNAFLKCVFVSILPSAVYVQRFQEIRIVPSGYYFIFLVYTQRTRPCA